MSMEMQFYYDDYQELQGSLEYLYTILLFGLHQCLKYNNEYKASNVFSNNVNTPNNDMELDF